MGHISQARTSLAPSGVGVFLAQPACLGSQTDQRPPSILDRLIRFRPAGVPQGDRLFQAIARNQRAAATFRVRRLSGARDYRNA